MPAVSYDLITIGGGLGGASLAKAMADRGARVLVLEREPRFKDRVRGEQMHPWGVAEAKLLGIYDLPMRRLRRWLPRAWSFGESGQHFGDDIRETAVGWKAASDL